MAYPGGKNGSGVYQKIINLMPPHQIYIEPFLGNGAILKLKRPAPIVSIGIDVDAAPLIHVDAELISNGLHIPGLRLLTADSIQWLAEWRSKDHLIKPDTLIYCDPPYLMSTRSCQRQLYLHELTEARHVELLRIIRELPCMVMISGYYSELYAQTLAGWRSIHFQAKTRGGAMATEWVWMNFSPPLELHDYRYLGQNFRERERIKKKQRRWKARLERMPELERYALLSVIGELSTSETARNSDIGQ